ncbi:Complexed with Cdc5 protein cwf19 [Mycena indigotica]|uniref:Complexed with Cdc5 protein cwf19 n=1 Tax=Mycena indigotica TaxID=2126181 RepID=A0A8H6SGN5_9AGAR|nr:Complexed with Cdc5 protein cwf19 [Mycena indigotica]KAF7299218.1 Complexed with Cdc5 protein cwf19 [Mycena indigotica]
MDDTSSKRKRSKHDSDKKHKKRSKHDDEDGERKHKKSKKVTIVDEDPNEEDMWVEKNIDMDGERLLTTDIPTAKSLKLTSAAIPSRSEPPLQRDDWMLAPASETPQPARKRIEGLSGDESFTEDYGEPSQNQRTLAGGVDFFSSLGTEVKRRGKDDRPDPTKPVVHAKELNPEVKLGMTPNATAPPPKTNTPGGPGSSWRMMRLRKVYETAEEEGLSIEQVAVDRFGSLEAFEEAKEERRILDEREEKRSGRRDADRGRPEGERRFMFNDVNASGGSSRSSSFRRPGGPSGGSGPSTPAATAPTNRRLDALRLPSAASSPLAQARTPIPSVMTPSAGTSKSRALSPSSLNRLQAKVIRAKLMGAPDADALEREYEAEARKANGGGDEGGVRTRVEVLPTLDGHGRLYDVGHGAEDDRVRPGNRRKKEEKFETHDPKTGEILRYNANDDTTTLGEMLRQERFGGGMADQKNLDAEFARSIMSDGKFQNDLDYIDDNAEKLGRQKMRSDAMKRQFAINDYKRTQKVLAECHFCYGEDGETPPKAPVVAMGTRAYLSCTTNEELVKGHCLIVPIQHHLNMLEADDDVWDEVRNFMKCLMRMFAEDDQGVIFYETVISLKGQKHTFIECIPLPWEQFEDIPQYFKESILASEAEWSQHKKLIDFSSRPGGFRRAMVPNLPYFMVQFDYKGEKGYGHVIEGTGDGGAEEEDAAGFEEGEKGGGEFPRYFAGEIIGNVLELEPRKWRRPKRVDFRSNKERVGELRKKFDKFDWTAMIGKASIIRGAPNPSCSLTLMLHTLVLLTASTPSSVIYAASAFVFCGRPRRPINHFVVYLNRPMSELPLYKHNYRSLVIGSYTSDLVMLAAFDQKHIRIRPSSECLKARYLAYVRKTTKFLQTYDTLFLPLLASFKEGTVDLGQGVGITVEELASVLPTSSNVILWMPECDDACWSQPGLPWTVLGRKSCLSNPLQRNPLHIASFLVPKLTDEAPAQYFQYSEGDLASAEMLVRKLITLFHSVEPSKLEHPPTYLLYSTRQIRIVPSNELCPPMRLYRIHTLEDVNRLGYIFTHRLNVFMTVYVIARYVFGTPLTDLLLDPQTGEVPRDGVYWRWLERSCLTRCDFLDEFRAANNISLSDLFNVLGVRGVFTTGAVEWFEPMCELGKYWVLAGRPAVDLAMLARGKLWRVAAFAPEVVQLSQLIGESQTWRKEANESDCGQDPLDILSDCSFIGSEDAAPTLTNQTQV